MKSSFPTSPVKNQRLLAALDGLADELSGLEKQLDLRRPEGRPNRDLKEAKDLVRHVRDSTVSTDRRELRVDLECLVKTLDEFSVSKFDAGDFAMALAIDRHLLSIWHELL